MKWYEYIVPDIDVLIVLIDLLLVVGLIWFNFPLVLTISAMIVMFMVTMVAMFVTACVILFNH